MKKMSIIILLLLTFSVPAFSWDKTLTHPALSEYSSLQKSSLNNYLIRYVRLDDGIDSIVELDHVN